MHRILLIDDNETDLFIGKRLFLHYNEKLIIETCMNGQEALEHLTKGRATNLPHPDIIICDIEMPIMDGYDFVIGYDKMFRDQRNNCCILIYSSTLDRSEMELFKNHPLVCDFFQKPIEPDRIIEYVESKNRQRYW